MAVCFSIETPTRGAGAIGIIRLSGERLDESLIAIGLPPVPVGAVVLADILGVDRGLVARWSARTADLMLHGGPGVLGAARAALARLGIPEKSRGAEGLTLHGDDLRSAWPESANKLEAAMLEALAMAPSPRAVPLLLAQPARHAAGPGGPYADAALDRLLSPPLVLITGAPNVGKSSLLNAIARREAALVADMPGTTRDAVAVTAVIDGLAVRLIDAPGFDAAERDPIVRAASGIAARLEAAADLVLRCDDGSRPPPETNRPSLAVRTKADLGGAAPAIAGAAAIAVSARTGAGVADLALSVRRALVSDAALADERPWRFGLGP